MPLVLRLRQLAPEDVIADRSCKYPGNVLPRRARALEPAAAAAWFAGDMHSYVVVSDMRRSATSSKVAVKKKRGALPPGYSLHGAGIAIDTEVAETMERLDITGRYFTVKKEKLDFWMCERGWVPLLLTPKNLWENWHYWFAGLHFAQRFKDATGSVYARIRATGLVLPKETKTQQAAERMLVSMYRFKLNPKEVQECLATLGLYDGEIDGELGKLSTQAITIFQKAWGLKADGIAGTVTQRVLAFVAAEIVYV